MHIDNHSWLGVFKEQEELAALQAPDDAEPDEPEACEVLPRRLRLVASPEPEAGS